jgi:hypothetical protein
MAHPASVISNSDKVIASLKKLASLQVMVGIPATRAPRNDIGITNAALGYIHEFGSPARNIPARPFLMPGVLDAKAAIAARLQSAAKAAMDGNDAAMLVQLKSAGQEAVTSVQNKITEGPFEPLAPSTIAHRMGKLQNTTALTPAQRAQGFADIKPLIDTGQLRASITYVVRSRSGEDVG